MYPESLIYIYKCDEVRDTMALCHMQTLLHVNTHVVYSDTFVTTRWYPEMAEVFRMGRYTVRLQVIASMSYILAKNVATEQAARIRRLV